MWVCVCVCVYMYMCVYIYIYIYIYTLIPRCNKAYVWLRDEKTPLYLSRFGSAEKREAEGTVSLCVGFFVVFVWV